MDIWPPDVILRGRYVDVVPLCHGHLDDLKAASADGDLQNLWYTWIPSPDEMKVEIDRRLNVRKTGTLQPFSIINKVSGRVIGMTTYMHIDAANKRVEIGSTWYGKSAQRTPINTECKLLLLKHAFEELGCIAVEFRTHFMNMQSRRAIERIGAKFDGVLRNHTVMANGTVRDTAVYSIISNEWPTVAAHLQFQLDKPRV